MSNAIQEQIEHLRRLIEEHNYKYYVQAAPVIDDVTYDRLLEQLSALEQSHPEYIDPSSPTQRVGSDASNEFISVPHSRPMLSLSNTYNYDEVSQFWQQVSSATEEVSMSCELKFDGLSIAVIYIDGKLSQAITRGDGTMGDDVTANIRAIRSIPLRLRGEHIPHRVEVRGEVLMPFAVFDALNKERTVRGETPFANPRNAAAGTLKNLNPRIVYERKLDAYFYYLLVEDLPDDSHTSRLLLAQSWGIRISPYTQCCRSLDEVYRFIDYWDEERHQLPVATDGVVLKIDSLSRQEALGFTSKSPRWAIAYKYQAERASTPLLEVTYQVGRTGVVTPVANLTPILLSGSVVRRATLHNADFMSSLDLHEGDLVYVEKGGEIIPKIVGVERSLRTQEARPIVFPSVCPDCGTPLIKNEGEVAWVCPNKLGCPMQIKGVIEHFVGRKAADINIGPETIEQLYQKGLVHAIEDLYQLTREDLLTLDGFKERATQKLLESIEASKQRPFAAILFGLGIRYVGETIAKSLALRFPSIELLCAASIEELLQVDDVGSVVAQSVYAYCRDPRALYTLEALREAGVTLESATPSVQNVSSDSMPLLGMRIVISGVFAHHSREEYTQLIETLGGKNTSSISAKTTFVLAGEAMGSSKKAKAEELGIPMLSEEDFLEQFVHKSGEEKE